MQYGEREQRDAEDARLCVRATTTDLAAMLMPTDNDVDRFCVCLGPPVTLKIIST